MSYLWVMIGSGLGGLLRFTFGKLAIPLDTSTGFPVGTVLINIIGSFVIGYFGTLTLHGGSRVRTASALGITRQALLEKAKRLGL